MARNDSVLPTQTQTMMPGAASLFGSFAGGLAAPLAFDRSRAFGLGVCAWTETSRGLLIGVRQWRLHRGSAIAGGKDECVRGGSRVS